MSGGRIWLLVGGLVSAVVMVFGWFIAAMPMLDQASLADQRRVEIETLNAAHERRLAEMIDLDGRKPELLREYEQLTRTVPAVHDLEGYFDWVAEAAAAAAITLTTAEAQDAAPYQRAGTAVGTHELSGELVSSLSVIRVELSIGGTAEQVSAFLRMLQSEGRLQLIDTATINLGSTLASRITGYVFVIGGGDIQLANATEPGSNESSGSGEAGEAGETQQPEPSATPTPPAEG